MDLKQLEASIPGSQFNTLFLKTLGFKNSYYFTVLTAFPQHSEAYFCQFEISAIRTITKNQIQLLLEVKTPF